MNDTFKIRMVEVLDAKELLEIYRPYVMNTAITFEYEVPTLPEFTNRITTIIEKYPYIVGEENGVIVGYAYASSFKQRAAYDWAVETSIYVKSGNAGKGYGKKLYQVLENILKMQNILNANACISYTKQEDDHLTNNSMQFHERMGYRLIGEFNQCGYKFGTWYDMIWMEKLLGEHTSNPDKVIPVKHLELKGDLLALKGFIVT